MRIVRFSPGPDAGLGTDPLFGILDEDNLITIIDGDPIYQGIVKTAARIELTKVRLLAPVIPRSKVVAIGKNYADHAAEMGSVVPDEPIIFLKANTTIIGPGPSQYPGTGVVIHAVNPVYTRWGTDLLPIG